MVVLGVRAEPDDTTGEAATIFSGGSDDEAGRTSSLDLGTSMDLDDPPLPRMAADVSGARDRPEV
jgi:hypothetical protein